MVAFSIVAHRMKSVWKGMIATATLHGQENMVS
jgi:hypothetical protein